MNVEFVVRVECATYVKHVMTVSVYHLAETLGYSR